MPGPKRRTDWQQPYLEALTTFGFVKHAARTAGVSHDSIQRERERYPEFAVAEKEAQGRAHEHVERAMRSYALVGVKMTREVVATKRVGGVVVESTETVTKTTVPSVTAAIFYLKSHMPDTYRETTRIEGANGGPIQLSNRDMEEVDRDIRRIMDDLAPRRAAKAAERPPSGRVARTGEAGAASS